MRLPAWWKRAAQVGLGVFVVAALGLWQAFESGWIVHESAVGRVDLCGGRVQRTFDSFWERVSQQPLDSREAYTIYADHGEGLGKDRKTVALKHCRDLSDGDLDCRVHEADEVDDVAEGESYRLRRASIANWSYLRGTKSHMGCEILRKMMPALHNPCETASRKNFSEFQWAATRDAMDPLDHWVDVRLAPLAGEEPWADPMEARLNRCERLGDGSFACRIDSAPPEAGLENDAHYVVEDHQVLAWRYQLGERSVGSCDGVEPDVRWRLPLALPNED